MAAFRSALFWALVALSAVAVLSQDNDIEERGLRDSIKQITKSVTGVPSIGMLMRSVNMTEITRASTKVAKELSKSLRMDVFAAGKALAAAGAALGSVVFLGGMAGLLASGLGMFRYSPELYDSGYFSNRIGTVYPSVPTFSDAQALIYQKVQQAQQQYLKSQGGPGAVSGQRVVVGVPVHGQPVVGVNGARPQQQPANQEYYGERNGQKGRDADADGDFALNSRDARILKETKRPYNDELIPALQDLFKALTKSAEKVAPEVVKALRR